MEEEIKKIKERAKALGLNPSEDAIFIAMYIVSELRNEMRELKNDLKKEISELKNDIRDLKNVVLVMSSITLGAIIGFGIAILIAL